MRIFGLEVRRAPKERTSGARAVGGRWKKVFDWISGAWQGDTPYDGDDGTKPKPTLNTIVFACMRQLSTDIAKIPMLARRLTNGTWTLTDKHTWTKLIRKPNQFQTWTEFMLSWVLSKLTAGNTYVLKLRDDRGIVAELIVLNPWRVQPLVAPSTGNVYYEFLPQSLEGLGDSERVVVAATEIIHDKHLTLFHPLVGVPPLVVASLAASTGRRILRTYDQLYAAGAVPPGVLTVPEGQSEEEIKALATAWEEFRRKNKTAILEEGMKYEAVQAKAIDQQALLMAEWTAKEICIAFGVPPWKIGLQAMPVSTNAELAQLSYYEGGLQWLIECIEVHLDAGLDLPSDLMFQMDVKALYRMDTNTRYNAYTNGVKGGWLAPNEPRRWEDLPPVDGGDTPYLQQQNYALADLAKRGTEGLAQSSPTPAPPPDDGGAEEAGEGGAPNEDGDLQREMARRAFGQAYEGVYKEGTVYQTNSIVTHRGLWKANVPTRSRPGTDPAAWKLIVKGE